MVPVGTKSAASFSNSSAARASSRFTVGSSRYTSSPTSASAMARRISAVGWVTVSLRRSMARLVCRTASFSIPGIACVVMGFPVLKKISMRGRLPLYKFLEHFVGEQASARREADGVVFEVEKSVLHQLFDGGHKLVGLFTESLPGGAQRHAAIQTQAEEESLFQRLG